MSQSACVEAGDGKDTKTSDEFHYPTHPAHKAGCFLLQAPKFLPENLASYWFPLSFYLNDAPVKPVTFRPVVLI